MWRRGEQEGGGAVAREGGGGGGGWGPNKHCGQLSPRLNRTLTSRLEIEALPLFVVDNQAITNFTSVRIPPNSFHYQDQRTRMLYIFNVIWSVYWVVRDALSPRESPKCPYQAIEASRLYIMWHLQFLWQRDVYDLKMDLENSPKIFRHIWVNICPSKPHLEQCHRNMWNMSKILIDKSGDERTDL